MSDNIKGNIKVIIQPGDTKYGLRVTVPICSDGVNNGFIPYNTTIASVSHKIYALDNDNADVTTEMTSTNPTVSDGNVISIELKYPSTTGEGRYKLTMTLTLSSGATKDLDFSRIYAKDL